jgi:hypothetical protein
MMQFKCKKKKIQVKIWGSTQICWPTETIILKDPSTHQTKLKTVKSEPIETMILLLNVQYSLLKQKPRALSTTKNCPTDVNINKIKLKWAKRKKMQWSRWTHLAFYQESINAGVYDTNELAYMQVSAGKFSPLNAWTAFLCIQRRLWK